MLFTRRINELSSDPYSVARPYRGSRQYGVHVQLFSYFTRSLLRVLQAQLRSGILSHYKKRNPRPGDIIIIPAGVVHGWLDIPEHVDYLSFRPSPGILNAGWVHPVLKK